MRWRLPARLALLVLALAGCGSAGDRWPQEAEAWRVHTVSNPAPSAASASPDAAEGARLLDAYGCGACHLIPGVRGADSLAGPPLIAWSQRKTIAGTLPNTWQNTVRWILDPQAIEPGTYVVVAEVRANRVVVRPAGKDQRPGYQSPNDLLSRPIDELGIESLDDPLA